MASGYGQFCPVAKAAEVLGERWTPLVLRELICGSTRFSELRRGVPLMSPSLLSKRLKTLERAGVVERRGEAGVTEYRLTEAGLELRPVIEQLGVWGKRWARSELEARDLDPGLLMWDIHRRLNVGRMPVRRTVLRFELLDVFGSMRRWWLVVDRGSVDLCLKDPGYPLDLKVTTDLRTLTAVWNGDLALRGETTAGRLRLEGPKDLVRAFPSWLALSPFAAVPAADAPDGGRHG
jgi:DNA-binding HxlR family transcriptional regulator